jgi:hypothetical protein
MARYGYARISTRSQRDDSQLDALRAAGCERNWTDTRPAAARAPLACPTCGREPTTRHEAVQQREDLAIVWLHLDGDRVTEARHCVVCQPHGPVIDVSCSCCGNGPLITGQPPELGAQLAASALDWMHSRGWQLHPQPLCPADHR